MEEIGGNREHRVVKKGLAKTWGEKKIKGETARAKRGQEPERRNPKY
jgi:hypothetical protein